MIDLTDEGLRSKAQNLAYNYCKEDACWTIDSSCHSESADSIFESLQQVRDAAKKEERERCIAIVNQMPYLSRWGTNKKIETAIRQME